MTPPRAYAPPALSLKGVSVRRTPVFQLDMGDFTLPSGLVTCVAGANGSGKTTLIETVVGLLAPDTGSILVQGQRHSPSSVITRRTMGFVPDDDAWIIPELTAREYFDLLASIYEQAGITLDWEAVLARLCDYLLFNSFDQQLGSLSHGNKKKVQLVAALMHQPSLLIVDELRNGLDPIAIRRAENLLRTEAEYGTAILAATHDLWWAERFADEIIMLHQGNVILQAPTKQIVERAGSVENMFMQVYGNRR